MIDVAETHAVMYCTMEGQTRAVGTTIKELVLLREPPTLHVYNVVEHGRQWYRSLVYTTDTRYTLEERQPTLPPPCAAGDPHASLAKGLSVAISRDWDHPRNLSVTRETYVPGRLLKVRENFESK